MKPAVLGGGLWALLLPVLAFWPTWHWYFNRMIDGSDEPCGIVALMTALGLMWMRRGYSNFEPLHGAPLALMYAVLFPFVPALVSAGLALTACGAYFGLIRDRRYSLLALLLLSLPILSSAQFFAGYPMRALAGEIAAQLISLAGIPVQRSGTMLEFNGSLVWIDAPCSGIRAAWCTSYVLSTLASIHGLNLRRTILASVGVLPLVLFTNVSRISILFFVETSMKTVPAWLHDGIGILTLTGAILGTILVVRLLSGAASNKPEAAPRTRRSGAAVFGCICAVSAVMPFVPLASKSVPPQAIVSWPETLDGETLRPAELTERDQKFASEFPGAFKRFQAGDKEVLIRYVTRATRKLHPASDCLQGSGYTVRPLPAERSRDGRVRSCVKAENSKHQLRVCEEVRGSDGSTFADPSTWFWEATFGRTRGPWFDVVTSEQLDNTL